MGKLNKKVGYFIIIGIFLMAFFVPLVNASAGDIAKVPVEYSLADGWIQTRGGVTCKDLGYNATTTAGMGVNGYTKCLPDGKTENHTMLYSFNTSNYSICTINSVRFHYYIQTISTNPRTFVWNPIDYNSLLEVYVASDRIGTQLDFTDDWFPTVSVASITPSLLTVIGWRNVTIPNSNISNGFLDIEIRPNKDYWQEMNDETKTKTFTIRTTEYAGVTSDPYLEINYTNCLTSPTANITSPLEQEYKLHEDAVSCSYELPLQWTAIVNNPLQNLTTAWYSLDGGANISLLNTPSIQENPNSWENTLDINNPNNCVDGDWTTFGWADGLVVENWEYLSENFTIPSNVNLVGFTGKYGGNGIINITCYNSSNQWYSLSGEIWMGGIEFDSFNITEECLNNNILQIRNELFYSSAMGITTSYYEGNVTWYYGLGNTTLYLEEGDHNVTVCVNDTSSFIDCDTHSFSIVGYLKTYSVAVVASFLLAAFFF